MMRLRRASHFLEGPLIVLLQWALVVSSFSSLSTPQTQDNFFFTENVYNGTISEKAHGKTYILSPVRMGIHLVDTAVNVEYSIERGDRNIIFRAEAQHVLDFCFLQIRTRTDASGELNREHKDRFLLQVKAVGRNLTGTVFTASTSVKITVLDENDLSPLFYPEEYSVTIPENKALHKGIVTVTASDADIGINGEVYYSFVQQTKFFSIHPATGVVSLTRSLNYTLAKVHRLTILAEDRGPKTIGSHRSSTASLEVIVTPVNYYSPHMIIQKLPTVAEHGNIPTVYAIVTVTDNDHGENGKIGSVEITAGNLQNIFKVEKSTEGGGVYNIIVDDVLDREKFLYGFNLTVTACDTGSPHRTTTTHLHVSILDTNDNEPKFDQEHYNVSVSEVVPINTPVVAVWAGDKDEGRNGEVEYSIVGGNDAGLFKIDMESGLISTTSVLDTEKLPRVSLKIQAEDQANSGARKQGKTHVNIVIKDFNDNAPIFDKERLSGSVKENAPKGTSVLRVSASDADNGENGRVSYSITNVLAVPFEIDHFTGTVKTTQSLDFEIMRKIYYVQIRASDWGSPQRQETETIVTIKLENLNDNKPEFEKISCTGFLSREAKKNTEIVILPAIDFDEGDIITYNIVDGNVNNCFEIVHSTGGITLGDCDLTQIVNDTIKLQAVAHDGVHYSTPTSISLTLVNSKSSALDDARVDCQVTDVTERLRALIRSSNENNKDSEDGTSAHHDIKNDYAPSFSSSVPKYFEVSEGTPQGIAVLNMTATDRDSNAWYNSKLLYVISAGNSDGTFKMDTFTGSLLVLSRLDREVCSEYNLQVTAQDMGIPAHSAKQLLRVVVTDENDNSPVFEHDHYEKSIYEYVAVNSTVLQVYATDADKDLNARIEYSLISDTEDFYIEPSNGIIKVKRQLDRERQPVYELEILAKDSGIHTQLSSTTQITIKLQDVNDNEPKFVPSSYSAKVREDLPVGSVVMILTASDPDVGGNGQVTYKLVDGMEDKFDIDEETGTIRIQDQLDYETKQVYNITAKAEDGGEPRLISTCLVNVEVVDVDENLYPPVFDNFVERSYVYENKPIGTFVRHVKADDPVGPEENSGQINYSIRDGSGLGRFTIDNNGTIRTSQVLDRETASHYWLTVYAQDRGLVPKFARLELLIEIEDENDNIPLSLEPSYHATVKENSKSGVNVIQVKAEDGDMNKRQKLSFHITGGDPQHFFEINETTGIIMTTERSLNREIMSHYSLEVTISDNIRRNPLSSTTRVTIQVLDENDNRPRFADKAPTIRVLQQAHRGTDIAVYRVVAQDKDEGDNANLTYTIKAQRGSGQTQFRVDAHTGMIYSTKDLVRGRHHELQVKAVDGGVPQRKASIKLRIEVVSHPTSSPNPPRFLQSEYSLSVAENEPIGQLVEMLSGEDIDGDSIWYSIEGGNEDYKFAIQPEHGTLSVAGRLDWESQSHYNLTVCATDGVNKTCVPVCIAVMDNNDYEPEFSKSLYTAQISENAALDTDVVQVSATDRDQDKRLFYTFESAGSYISMQKFKIHPQTGMIRVSQLLDREVLSHHILTVMVKDLGTPSKKSFARVKVTVLDHNDHAPQFLSSTFNGRVFETASVGTSVVQVLARDNDKGENAEMSFSVISGNIGGAFAVDEKLGIVSVVKPLNRAVQSQYDVVVMAIDHGNPPLTSTAHVAIMVTLSNNSPPIFTKKEYTAELSENQPAGHIVLAVHADSQSSVVYEIESGNHFGLMMINPNSGVVSTKMAVDYEKHHLFNLTIKATNIVGASSNCTVTIHILDVNDNRPEFQEQIYIGSISEKANPNSIVFSNKGSPLVVKAFDKDSGVNSLLKYEILVDRIKAFFAIDPSTGAIQTLSTLDHETNSIYNFTVQVSDLGKPNLMTEFPARVIIYISDVNDTPPKFTNYTYMAKVLLPTYKDVIILHLTAQDPDTDSLLTYSIVRGNNDNVFDMNPNTGDLFVNNESNIEDKYDLTVQVSDGKHVTTASVIVTVEKTVNSGLHFSREVYTVSVEEEQEDSKELIAVMAVGHRLNEPLEFTLLNNRAMFTVKKTSGVLETRGIPFDREVKTNYTVIVEVRDTRGRLAHGVVIVTVTDINDNAPQFVGLPFNSVIAFNASKGDVVKTVQAFDGDEGSNGQVRYSITDGGEGKFNINLITGDITVEKLLASDKNTVFQLTVEAQDMGHRPQRQEAVVPIHVVDNNSPVFRDQVYNVSVRENIAMHTTVTKIEAFSPQDHKLIYSISKGDKYGDFAVNFDTGLISVVGTLDYEETKMYELTLRATDIQTGSYTEAIVFVYLQDVNDNAPVFDSQFYTKAVTEAVPIGDEILSVRATDQDTHLNNQVHYTIAAISMGNQDVDTFHIDSDSGVVWLRKRLDYEIQSDFYLIVIAIDNGIPALNTTVTVHIKVLNLNDNAPKFSQAYYECGITDQAKRGQLVTKVMAFDNDQSNEGFDQAVSESLFYSIVDGNEKQTFAINTNNGLITVSEQRKPDFQPAYMLNVSVSDGVYTSYARVTIAVRNTNRHAPIFHKSHYYEDFSEINAKGMPVVTVSATDEDRGTYGLVTYTIPSDRMKKIFHIDADTGEINTKIELDREKQSVYDVPVAATDNGGQMGFATVHVTVTDYNDCIPHFLVTDYQGNVFSNATVGQRVLQVKAVDEDAGVNGRVVYSLYPSGNTDVVNLFQLNSETGLITVKGDLSRKVNKVFQFFVGATNKEETSMQDRAAVDILVMGLGDSPPSFEMEEYTVFIQEDISVTSVIATLKAITNQPVKYSIVPGSAKRNNNPIMFSINSKAQITVSEALDREDVSSYLLTIKAETRTSPPLVAYTEVNITLRDVNDNNPTFDSEPYIASISENAPTETKLVQLQAYDADQPAMFIYKFGDGMEEAANIFSLDAHTGWLTLMTSLDREVNDEYNITVVVYDNQDNVQNTHSSSGTVIISVTDFNDNAPVFPQNHFNTAVDEGAALGTVLRNITATDGDIGDNALISYYITGGDPLGQFQVHSTAEIFVNRPLDRETNNRYKLSVAATDGGFVTYISVTVDILDDNDHSPTCKKSLYTKFVAEDVHINSVIEHVQASDEDESNTRNSKLSYYVSGEGVEYFIMEKESGVLRTAKDLDREYKAEYHLVTSAVDGGQRSCTANVFITVTDINDNRPEFTLKTTTFHIAENAQVNTLLTRVTAIDLDSGINRRIKFELVGEYTDVFEIDPVSGIISVMKSLDREKQSEYNVTVIAYNPGAQQFSSTLKLMVVVGDVNDNPPKFQHSNYYTAIREDTVLNSRVLEVLATSQDIGQNAKITYSITGGNEQGKFKIDPALGTLRVAEPLDHELSKQYFLTVMATDKGEHPLSSSTVVVINVTDVNDNPPQFGQTAYSCSVKEDISEGSEVIRVQATDVDSFPNAVIHYSIVKGDQDGKFGIGTEDGVIRIRKPLDREMVDKYALIVMAQDSGVFIPRSTSTVVSVEVMDANDNPPRFNQANYTARVQEGRRAGIGILQFTVTDIDREENGPPFDFDIVNGNSGMEFHVNEEGLLSTATKLNKDLKDSYELTVRVFDSGQPTQYADTSVTIYVVDESMHPPVVRNLSITISSYKDRFPGGVIGKVDYQDDDLYDTIAFQVVSNNRYLFDVDRDSGNVIAVLGLDAGHYEVNVSVSDGKFTSYSQVTVNVISISEEMVNSAITIQFENMIPEQFFANSKKDFQSILKRELDVSARSIEIINVQPAATTGARENQRMKRATSSNLDVLFAVRKSGNRFYNKNSLRKKVNRAVHRIEEGVGVKVTKVFSDMCNESTCTEGVCVGKVVFDNNKLTPVIVGGESFVSARHYYSYQCTCLEGNCPSQICGGIPCPSYKLCEQDDFGKHVCVCPNGLTGERCDEEPPECKPSDANCHKGELPMTFTGHSYARWELAVKTDKRLTLSLWLRTRKLNANLMNSKGKADYSMLEIINGHLQYKFDCGSGQGLVTIPITVNDGMWHMVSIERNGRIAQMELDERYQAMSTAPGTNDILNLHNDNLYFGAEVTMQSNYQDISHGFEGCMRDIRVFDVPLLFSGKNKVTRNQHFEKIDFNCKEDPWKTNPHICSSHPCMHGGTCVYTGLNSYICQCEARYQGSKCEVDTNPCEDSPCMHQGQCRKDNEIPNGFLCKCRGRFKGKRCEYGDYCIPNPCQHGGVCIEGPHKHICQCRLGFEGSSCELTTISDVCGENPCQNGGTCHVYTGGAYHCNCTSDRKGRHCDEIILPVITGGIKAEEIYGIAGVGAGLILIVLMFVMCRLWRRKRRERRRNAAGIIQYDDEIQYHGMKEHEMKRKLSNPDVTTAVHTYTPQPPPVPTRPASYTPSTHDSLNTLNNFDTVRNYGSAADELETTGIHSIPTFQEYLETFQSSHRNSPIIPSPLLPPPRSNAPSDSDSIQKQPWEFDYPNILEHYPEDKKGVSSKCMPGVAVAPCSLQRQDASSYSSLPVSESEEDLNGYHWDTSDWAPRPSLPNISEVPAKEVPDSPTSSSNSEDSNNQISNIEPDPGMLTDDPGEYVEDSEYVGDSEYAENEFGLDDHDDLPPCYADHPNYQQILELRDMDDTYELPQSLQVSHHPNHYLPNYSFSGQMEQEGWPDPTTDDDNSDASDDNDNDSVIHYGYQNVGPPRSNLGATSYVHGCDYNTDHDRSAASILDDMSVSVGGYTSTNGSCSDVSAYLCEIEDSEINQSDESGDEDQSTQSLLAAHLHTKV